MSRVSILVASLIIAAGCQPPAADVARGTPAEDSPPAAAAATVAADFDDPRSLPPLTLESPAEAVCERFVRRLHAEQLAEAERLLSQEALTEIRKTGLQLSAPGSPAAIYTFHPPQFATLDQKIAFVPCDVSDGGISSRCSYMLRRTSHGWKISGMMLGAPDEPSSDLLSFENPRDVAAIRDLVEPVARQAQRPAGPDETARR